MKLLTLNYIIKHIIEQARRVVITNVNIIILETYCNIGKRIIEE